MGNQGGDQGERDKLVHEFQEFLKETGVSLTADQAQTVFELYVHERREVREMADKPAKRAQVNILCETVTKWALLVVAVGLAIHFVNLGFENAGSAEAKAELSKKLFEMIPAVLGGLGGGLVIGKQWMKGKSES